MAMSHSELDTWFKQQAGAQLRTFSKAVSITHSTYYSTSGGDSLSNQVRTNTYSASTAPDSTFNGDLDSGIGSGLVAEAADVTASIANGVRSAVDYIEGTVITAAKSASFICHNSCHGSCHGSRGRR